MFFEESFLFLPTRFPEGNWQPEGIHFEDAHFESRDGSRLHGWYIHRENPSAVLLFCNGQAGNLTWQAPFLERLCNDTGVSLLTFDYRGYGQSEGQPSERGIFQDVRAARDWLSQRAAVSNEQIVVCGASLGSAVALDLAADEAVRALVLLSPFTSVMDMAALRFPYIPFRFLLRTRLDSLSKIGKYCGPLLVCHGTSDTVIPYSMGERLFAAANDPKQMLAIPEWGHDTPPPDAFFHGLREFLGRVQ